MSLFVKLIYLLIQLNYKFFKFDLKLQNFLNQNKKLFVKIIYCHELFNFFPFKLMVSLNLINYSLDQFLLYFITKGLVI